MIEIDSEDFESLHDFKKALTYWYALLFAGVLTFLFLFVLPGGF